MRLDLDGRLNAGLPGPAGRVAEQMGNLELALSAYENALRHNPMSLSGLTQVAGIARIKENYPKVRAAAARVNTGRALCLSGPAIIFSLDHSRSLTRFPFRQSSISNASSTCSKTTAKSGAHSVSAHRPFCFRSMPPAHTGPFRALLPHAG